MKNFFKIFSVFIFCLALFSCSKEGNIDQLNEVESNENSQFTSKEDRLKFFGKSNTPNIGAPVRDFSLRVESDLVKGDHGCYTVNVRVYGSDGETTYLLANQNVQVGEPCNTTDSEDVSESEECETGYIRDTNDFVLHSELKNEYCLLNLLTNYDEIYDKYIKSRDELLLDSSL
ncbi:hypothetical protein [Mesonia maritima]|uniref:Lipoprotein n=1 Tax=Mesonia maritima TaxID=1793873 RepID=A0ABU1K8W4_9FLAO|nr:hypothetical protein [Mesonia maritima]MDR6302045.1 hypothetical protein [Mesonia maritima]